MKIAIMGIRGIPANYGGFETFIEEMAPRLARRGHDVTVYGRANMIDYADEMYKGVCALKYCRPSATSIWIRSYIR